MAAGRRSMAVVPHVVLYIDSKPEVVQRAKTVFANALRLVQCLALSLEEAMTQFAKEELSGVRLVVFFLDNARPDLGQAIVQASNLVHFLQRRRDQPALDLWVSTKNSKASNALLIAGCRKTLFLAPSAQDLENVVLRLTAR